MQMTEVRILSTGMTFLETMKIDDNVIKSASKTYTETMNISESRIFSAGQTYTENVEIDESLFYARPPSPVMLTAQLDDFDLTVLPDEK